MTLDSEGYRVRGHDVWICVLLPGNSKLFCMPLARVCNSSPTGGLWFSGITVQLLHR